MPIKTFPTNDQVIDAKYFTSFEKILSELKLGIKRDSYNALIELRNCLNNLYNLRFYTPPSIYEKAFLRMISENEDWILQLVFAPQESQPYTVTISEADGEGVVKEDFID